MAFLNRNSYSQEIVSKRLGLCETYRYNQTLKQCLYHLMFSSVAVQGNEAEKQLQDFFPTDHSQIQSHSTVRDALKTIRAAHLTEAGDGWMDGWGGVSPHQKPNMTSQVNI